jgi:hypothetical protein
LTQQIKITFLKIKKFVFDRISAAIEQEIKAHLDADSKEYCFKNNEFFMELYKEVRFITSNYEKKSKG